MISRLHPEETPGAGTKREILSTSFYAAGEIIGGLFFHNDISVTGLTALAVIGHIAGGNTTRRAKALMGL